MNFNWSSIVASTYFGEPRSEQTGIYTMFVRKLLCTIQILGENDPSLFLPFLDHLDYVHLTIQVSMLLQLNKLESSFLKDDLYEV